VVITHKNKEIDLLKAQMEEMAQEFGDMLKVSGNEEIKRGDGER